MRRLFFMATTVASIISTDAATAQDLFGGPESAVAVEPTDQAKPGKVDGKAKLQAEFLNLSKARAEMMNEEELTRAIAEAKKVNNRIAARRDLERAMAILAEIVDKHPDTPEGRAALRGKQALRVIELRRGDVFLPRAPTPEPIPDPSFGGVAEDDVFRDIRRPMATEPRPDSRPIERSVRKPRNAEKETERFGDGDGGFRID